MITVTKRVTRDFMVASPFKILLKEMVIISEDKITK